MVGYIYVTDAPYFGTTEAAAPSTLKDCRRATTGSTIWSPYIADAPASLTRTVHVEGETRRPLRASS